MTNLLFILISQLFAGVELQLPSDESITLGATTTAVVSHEAPVYVELNSGEDPQSSSIAYFPFSRDLTSNGPQDYNIIASTSTGNTRIPYVNGSFTHIPYTQLKLQKLIPNDGYKLYMAVESDSNVWRVVPLHPSIEFTQTINGITVNSESPVNYFFLWKDMVDVVGDNDQTFNNSSIHQFNYSVYFFLDKGTGTLNTGARILPTDTRYQNGLYLSLEFSDDAPQSEVALIDSLRKGDGRLYIGHDHRNISLSSPVGLAIWSGTSSGLAAGDATAHFNSGTITKTTAPLFGEYEFPATNNQTYHLAIAPYDRFYFTPQFSASQSGTPEQITGIIEKQRCFILSAGFKREHWIVDYFKALRDEKLLTNKVGRYFNRLYYKYAKNWAPFILKHTWLQKTIQGLAFFLYYLLNYFLVVMLVVALGLVVLFLHRSQNSRDVS